MLNVNLISLNNSLALAMSLQEQENRSQLSQSQVMHPSSVQNVQSSRNVKTKKKDKCLLQWNIIGKSYIVLFAWQ